jgi:hypothetical protein
MANAAPATVTISSTIGPGLTVASLKFTDVTNIEVDFFRNLLKITRQGSGSTQIYDYSALGASITWTVTGGAGGGPSVLSFS